MVLAVLVACAVNAASFNWQAANIYGSDGQTKFTGDVKLYAVIGGVDTLVHTAEANAGAVTKTATTFENSSLEAGTGYNFYFVIEEGGKTFTSDTKTLVAQATATVTVNFGNMATATQDSSNWVGGGGDVPEPTSGLLLLVGGALLALRRKQK